MSKISTVKIVDMNGTTTVNNKTVVGGDYIIINQCNYNARIHTLFDDKPKKTRKPRSKKAKITNIKVGD